MATRAIVQVCGCCFGKRLAVCGWRDMNTGRLVPWSADGDLPRITSGTWCRDCEGRRSIATVQISHLDACHPALSCGCEAAAIEQAQAEAKRKRAPALPFCAIGVTAKDAASAIVTLSRALPRTAPCSDGERCKAEGNRGATSRDCGRLQRLDDLVYCCPCACHEIADRIRLCDCPRIKLRSGEFVTGHRGGCCGALMWRAPTRTEFARHMAGKPAGAPFPSCPCCDQTTVYNVQLDVFMCENCDPSGAS